MVIQYCSDLHFEFGSNRNYLKENQIIRAGEVLILAGDIMPFAQIKKFEDDISRLADQFESIYWVPGNHEYYDSDISSKPTVLHEKLRSNVFLVNNQQIQYKNVNLVFSTLWGHISPQNEQVIERSLNDFSLITNGKRTFTPSDFSLLHKECLSFLETTVKELKQQGTDTNTIVVTHHVPTRLNYPEEYKNSPLNEAFAVELFDFIEGCGVGWWIYGHHHINTPAFTIGSTQLVTNQLGYVAYEEHLLFRRDATIQC